MNVKEFFMWAIGVVGTIMAAIVALVAMAVVSILPLLLPLALLGGAVWVVCAVLKAFGII